MVSDFQIAGDYKMKPQGVPVVLICDGRQTIRNINRDFLEEGANDTTAYLKGANPQVYFIVDSPLLRTSKGLFATETNDIILYAAIRDKSVWV